MKRAALKVICALLLAGLFVFGSLLPAQAAQVTAKPIESEVPVTLMSPSCMLVEAESGAVIFEKNPDEKRPVASVTKLMTALLLFEKLKEGSVTLEDQVTVSSNAASMTGSQALLDANVQYPLKTLLQATIMASGNDSAVALAEYTAGTEEAFVQLMNARAEQLGMTGTHYKNCTGLPADGQYTTARDVAVLSCEVARHPEYFTYSSVWIDELKHPSGRITDLTNTNRLVRFYTDCDGFKTGSTNEAKYCVSATAQRNGMRLIAVVLGAPASQTRFDEARAMLDYGFATYRRSVIGKTGDMTGKTVRVNMGAKDTVEAALGSGLSLLLKSGQEKQLVYEADLAESVSAPVKKGDPLGTVRVLLNDQVIAEIPAVAASDVRLPGFLEGFVRILEQWK